jgi:hypothetical protein
VIYGRTLSGRWSGGKVVKVYEMIQDRWSVRWSVRCFRQLKIAKQQGIGGQARAKKVAQLLHIGSHMAVVQVCLT